MTHTITLNFNTLDELLNFTQRLQPQEYIVSPNATALANATSFVSEPAGMVVADKPRKKPKKAEVEITPAVEAAAPTVDLTTTETPPTAEEQAEVAAKAEPVDNTKALDYKTDVRPFAVELYKAEGGQTAMAAIFDEFGVTNATELTADQLPAFLAAVKKALGK